VRVNSLQELVYKQGQAGIQKATVTIVFDNHDRSQSPVGYEQFDTITVTRQVLPSPPLRGRLDLWGSLTSRRSPSVAATSTS